MQRIIQGVHKVSLQFQKFIRKANEETDKWKLLQNETYTFKFSLHHWLHEARQDGTRFLAMFAVAYSHQWWTMASVILCFRSVMSRIFVRYTISSTQPHVSVLKVSLQYQKFITKAIDEISSSDLFHVLSGYQGFYRVAFRVPC